MTPKEKAKELVDKFYEISYPIGISEGLNQAKQCSLVCIDEMIKALGTGFNMVDEKGNVIGDITKIPYWKKVKKHINKL